MNTDLVWVTELWDILLNLPGRALEELRSSLYNEMHSSESAKRQQMRFCGPSVALTFNFAVAVGIIMANKMVWLFLKSQDKWLYLCRAIVSFQVVLRVIYRLAGDGECWI